jgi:hypothetical protein
VCKAVAARDGIVLEILEGPDDFRGLLERIVDGLERRGIEGHFELARVAGVAEIPEKVALAECRMRVLGERYRVGRNAHWRVDPEAFWIVAQAGVRWCLGNPPVRGTSMHVGLASRAAVDTDAGLDDLMRDAIAQVADYSVCDLVSAGVDRYRMVVVKPSDGRVTLIDAGGELSAPGGWRDPTEELRAVLAEQADRLVYAFVKHGWNVGTARLGHSLADDWPPRPGFNANAGRGVPFEDQWAPDAFAMQLLGPEYDGRSVGETWQTTPLASGRMLVEHRDPEAWFDTPFAPFDGSFGLGRSPYEPPPVLIQAREDFADVLSVDRIAATGI